jgi:hypothetical protein
VAAEVIVFATRTDAGVFAIDETTRIFFARKFGPAVAGPLFSTATDAR